MIAILCALLSAICFYFSIGLGEQWWLAWLAPIPVLWLAFSETKWWHAFLAATMAVALGATNLISAYGSLMPVPLLIIALVTPSLLFAFAVMLARRVYRTLGTTAALFAFAATWTAVDFFGAYSQGIGSAGSPTIAEVGVPMLIQSASLVSYLGVTFLLGAVSAGLALALRTRRLTPAFIALALFLANLGYGYLRISASPTATERVALIESDDAVGKFRQDDKVASLKAIDAYSAEIAKLKDAHVALIVLPENISKVAPDWRAEAQGQLSAAATGVGATLVAGFNTNLDGAQRNVSWAFTPGLATPVTYEKRRLVPMLETRIFTPGSGPKVLSNGIGLEICKDMDFDKMLRADEAATRPLLLAVPAWDFGKDGWSHARSAILRSVENGVPMARTARDGLMTLNDRYGRIVARAETTGKFQTLVGDLPLSGRGGETLYDKIGDSFGWACALISLAFVVIARVRRESEV